jgi:heme-degrading monooxygenase HmoA
MGMAKSHFIYTWEFTAAPGKAAEFRHIYGAEGAWVKLFRRADGYLRSELLQDKADPQRFITVDHWESEEAWRAFRDKFRHEYEDLDVLCEQVTVKEREIGRFQPAD